ncbi:MAG: hypothetical protein E7640_03165 [Ruminococcaceae bacterium]|nr:hypothetical protein [Oscillospiraceae bacterium]
MRYVIGGISLPYTAEESEFLEIGKKYMKRAANAALFRFGIAKRSVDARKKNDIRIVCSVFCETDCFIDAKTEARLEKVGFRRADSDIAPPQHGEETLGARPLVVGAGPAGMFCALILAENGYSPILIDRGGSVEERAERSERLRATGELDTETNIQFGAGGAGTFSDGKLTTRINNPLCSLVLRHMFENGAPEDIMKKAKPHIGTDILRDVVSNILDRVKQLGAEVYLNTRLDKIDKNADGTLTARTSRGDILCGCAVMAIGHSARDTYSMLMEKGYMLTPKPFSVGVRIEHLRADIDRALYGDAAGDPRLGAAEYNFSYTKGERGVYTFCMCPGGEVVAAATEEGGVVVNGMSRRLRDGVNSNSAINVSVFTDDYGNTVDGAISYQRALERAAFCAGGGKFYAPVETVGDFLDGKLRSEPTRVAPSYMGGERYKVADLGALFPEYITSSLKRGISSFGKRLEGFDAPDAVLTGVETRTSAPVRILRNEAGVTDRCDRVYPCGEGAGYAGGIMSAAVDGISVAYKIIERFK